MKCTNLAERIERLRPGASVRDVARLCLLLTNSSHNVDELSDDGVLATAWNEMDLRLRSATDQHAAMTEDLECLETSDPRGFTLAQIWRLIRTIKVQSQILQLYIGGPVLKREC